MNQLENILIELIFVFLHFLLFLFNYRVMNKKIMQPAVLFSLLWFVIIALHFVFRFTLLNELFPLHTGTLVIFFLGVLSFSLGSLLVTLIKEKKEPSEAGQIPGDVPSKTPVSLVLRMVLTGIILVGLPFYVHAAYKIFIASNIENFFAGLRTALSYGDEDIGITKYLVSLSFVVYSINLYCFLKERNKTNKSIFISCLLITITYSIFTTGRTFFFMILALYLGMNFLHNRFFSVKKVAGYIVFFIIIFSILGIFIGKGGDSSDSIKDNIYPASQNTGIYLVSSVNALDWELHHNPQINYNGNNTLRFFEKLGEGLNLIDHVNLSDIVQGFVFVPYPTNVYTFYSPYIKDFGRLYAWFMIGLFGCIHTLLYDKAIAKKSLRYSIYYSFMLFPLLLSFFQDQYMLLISSWIQFIFYTEAILFVNALLISKTNVHGSEKNMALR